MENWNATCIAICMKLSRDITIGKHLLWLQAMRSIKPAAHDACFLIGLKSCHRIGCTTDSANIASNTMARIYSGIQQETKRRVPPALTLYWD